jgi:hypothetical protein
MVYYAMPLIMKTENDTSSQHVQQFCINSNQVVVSESNFNNGQLTSPPQPHQPQMINLSNGDVDNSSQNSYTYQLLTSNDQQQQIATQSPPNISTTPRTQKSTKSFKCDQCDMMFTTKSAHTSHIKSHAKQQQNNGGNNAAVSANGTTTSTQSSDPYQCDVCKKTFAVPARLVRKKFSTKPYK